MPIRFPGFAYTGNLGPIHNASLPECMSKDRRSLLAGESDPQGESGTNKYCTAMLGMDLSHNCRCRKQAQTMDSIKSFLACHQDLTNFADSSACNTRH